MGRKRARARQFIYFFAAGLMLPYLWSCTPDMKRLAPVKESSITVIREAEDPENRPWQSLQRARVLFAQGDFAASLEENQKVLTWAGGGPPGDRALFNMGLIYAYGANPRRDPGKSLVYFRRVVEEFPQSPLAEEAKTLAGLLQKNGELTKEMADLTQENVALVQEKAKTSQALEIAKQLEEMVYPHRDFFQRMKRFFEQENYEAALEENQKILSASGKNILKDQALFLNGLIYASVGNPKRDLEKSLSFFQRLLKEYPQSALTVESKTLIDLLQENLKLHQMIEKSKQVDIAIEEKKREKGR